MSVETSTDPHTSGGRTEAAGTAEREPEHRVAHRDAGDAGADREHVTGGLQSHHLREGQIAVERPDESGPEHVVDARHPGGPNLDVRGKGV